jgi:hypothetical protein
MSPACADGRPQASHRPAFIKPSHCHGVVILTFADHTVLCKLLKTILITVQNLIVAESGICARLTFPQHGAGCTKPPAASSRIGGFLRIESLDYMFSTSCGKIVQNVRRL